MSDPENAPSAMTETSLGMEMFVDSPVYQVSAPLSSIAKSP